MKKLPDKQVYTTGEAAQICGVSIQTIIRSFDSGKLQGFYVPGSNTRRIPRADLLRFMKKNRIPINVEAFQGLTDKEEEKPKPSLTIEGTSVTAHFPELPKPGHVLFVDNIESGISVQLTRR